MIDTDINFVNHDYEENSWIGIIVNNVDSTFSGRCQIRVFGLFDGIQDSHLPWAVPIRSTVFAGDGAGSISIPKIGQFVRVQFNNGDQYAPEYTAIQNIDSTLIERLKTDYEGTHVLLYDPNEDLTVIYQRNTGFQIFYKESFISISPDTLITLSTPNGESIVQMDGDVTNITTTNEVKIAAASLVEVSADEVIVKGSNTTKVGPGPYYKAILAEPLIALLKTMATALDAKMPATPGVNVGLVETAKHSMLSSNVSISI